MLPGLLDLFHFISLLALFIYVLALNNITTIHKAYLFFHSLMMMWPFGNFLINITPNQQYQWLFLNISFVCLCFLGYGWLIFSLVLTKKYEDLKRSFLYLSAIPAVLCSILVTTNPYHFLFAQPYNGHWAIRTYGPFFWVFVLTDFIYVSVATILMWRTMSNLNIRNSNMKKQLSLCLFGLIILVVFCLLDVLINTILYPKFGIIPCLTSFGIITCAICFVLAIQKYDLFRIVTIAQHEVIKCMDTGMIVLDNDEIVIDHNKSVTKFFNIQLGKIFDINKLLAQSKGKCINTNFTDDYSTDLLANLQAEIAIKSEPPMYITLNVSPVLDANNNFLGRIITLNDVTESRNLLDNINEKNNTLQKQNKELLQVHEELYQVNKKLEQLAITDALTGCYNKRYFQDQLVYEIAKDLRYKIPFSIMILDIDKFKLINDTYGHLMGDEVLQGMATLVQKVLRRSDILARFGGEEFVVYAPYTDRESSVVAAEKIRTTVQNHTFRTTESELHITVSIGLVSINENEEIVNTPEDFMKDLLTRADMSLYQAKAKGRNCVVIAG